MTYSVELKWWHPGLWLEVYTLLRNSGGGPLDSLWWTLVFLVHLIK